MLLPRLHQCQILRRTGRLCVVLQGQSLLGPGLGSRFYTRCMLCADPHAPLLLGREMYDNHHQTSLQAQKRYWIPSISSLKSTCLSVCRVPHNIRCICIQTVIAGLLSVTVVCICALHQFAAMMSARTMRVVCLPLRICINCYGTTLCISALCWHENHACVPMGCRGMCCQEVLCNTVNAYFSCCLVPVAHS